MNPPSIFSYFRTGHAGDRMASGDRFACTVSAAGFVAEAQDQVFQFPISLTTLPNGIERQLLLKIPFRGSVILPTNNYSRQTWGNKASTQSLGTPLAAITALEINASQLVAVLGTEHDVVSLGFDVSPFLEGNVADDSNRQVALSRKTKQNESRGISDSAPWVPFTMRSASDSSSAHQTPVSLLDRLRCQGSERDWDRFVELYRRLIEMWLSRGGVSPSDRDDLSQEVLTALVKSFPDFKHNGRAGAFRRWLKTVVIHRVLNYCRGRGRNHAVFVSLPVGDDSAMNEFLIEDRVLTASWEQEHDDFVIKQLVQLVASDFAQTTWIAFQRQVVEGQSAANVASDLGMTVNAALIAKSRVLKRLREEAAGLVD